MTARLFFLGAPHFEREGVAVELTVSKAVALLAYLAATARPQPRDRLLGLLWAESAEDAARKNLRNTLWNVRRALGDDVLVTGEERLALAPSAWADTRALAAAVEAAAAPAQPADARVAHLQAALRLYGGPFLDGLAVAEAPDFELWSVAERERLAQLHLRALAQLGDLYRASGRWAAALDTAQQALAQDNLQEAMYRLVMEANAALGRRGEALRQYDALRAALESELGVRPLPETEALAAAILAGAGSDAGAIRQAATPSRAQVSPGQSPPPAGQALRRSAALPFVGRRAEREVLDAALGAAGQGQAQVLLITGELGIGKSRLWQEWTSGLAPGPARVILEARCLEATQALPFAPLVQLFHSPTLMQGVLGPRSRLAPIWLAEVARLVPEIRLARPDLPAAAGLSADEERGRVFEALAQCLLALEARPLLLFVDDAHWADTATLNWLGYLVDRLAGSPLLLGVAYRAEEASPVLARLAAGWGRQGMARRLPLARLAPDEAAALVRTLGVAPLEAPRVHAQGAGNPYYLVELARAVKAAPGGGEPAPTNFGPIPTVLADLVRARLERLGGNTSQVLQAAAVLEPDFDFTTLRRASGRSEEETLDALDELLGSGVLAEEAPNSRPSGGAPNGGDPAMRPAPSQVPGLIFGASRYVFSHPLIATVVRAGLSGARRAFLYRRAAEALEATYAGRLSDVAGRLAADFAQAGDAGRAAEYAEMAAGRALALGAPEEAAAFYRQALAFEPTPGRELGLGRALAAQGDNAGARQAFETALAGFEARADREGAALASLAQAATYLPQGRGDEVLRWAEQSLLYLDTHGNPAADARIHTESHILLGSGRMRAGRGLDEAAAHLEEAVRLADEKGLPDLAARSRFELGTLRAQRGDLAGAISAYHAAIRLAQIAGDRTLEILGYNNAAYHELLAGDLDAAHAHIAAALALDDELALQPPRQYLYSTRGEIALAEKQWDEAETWLNRGLAEARKQGNAEQAAGLLANLAQVAAGRGDSQGALASLEAARAAAETLAAPYAQAQIDLGLAEAYAQQGDRAAGLAALERAEARLEGAGYDRLAAWAARLRGRLATQD